MSDTYLEHLDEEHDEDVETSLMTTIRISEEKAARCLAEATWRLRSAREYMDIATRSRRLLTAYRSKDAGKVVEALDV